MRNHLERLVFIDETALKTNMTKVSGWAPVGDRLIDHAPVGRWNTNPGLRPFRAELIYWINSETPFTLHRWTAP